MPDVICSVDDCPQRAHCRGYCLTHYNRVKTRGTPYLPTQPTPSDRFWQKVNKSGPTLRPDLGPCWVWNGSVSKKGYGNFWMNGPKIATRVSWFFDHGEFPPSDELVCHRCDYPSCVRPDHLFVGSAAMNNADMAAKGRHHKQGVTHCPAGHPYDEANTRIKSGSRICRQCGIEYKRRTRSEASQT